MVSGRLECMCVRLSAAADDGFSPLCRCVGSVCSNLCKALPGHNVGVDSRQCSRADILALQLREADDSPSQCQIIAEDICLHCCIISKQHVSHPHVGPYLLVYWLRGGRGWITCHLVGYAIRSLLPLCRRPFPTAVKRKAQRALQRERSLICLCCGCRMAQGSCR